jgi:hypothetical protein
MTDESTELTDAELEGESAETLPDREAMSIMTFPGDSLGPPPLDDTGEPMRGGEEL